MSWVAGLVWVWIAVAVLPWVLWALGWLAVEEWRDRMRARLAAQQAWQWLAVRRRHRACQPVSERFDRCGDPEVVVRRRVPVRG